MPDAVVGMMECMNAPLVAFMDVQGCCPPPCAQMYKRFMYMRFQLNLRVDGDACGGRSKAAVPPPPLPAQMCKQLMHTMFSLQLHADGDACGGRSRPAAPPLRTD
eukprot:scaffold76413_cov17-Tisochrysis_lutea.AAC.1